MDVGQIIAAVVMALGVGAVLVLLIRNRLRIREDRERARRLRELARAQGWETGGQYDAKALEASVTSKQRWPRVVEVSPTVSGRLPDGSTFTLLVHWFRDQSPHGSGPLRCRSVVSGPLANTLPIFIIIRRLRPLRDRRLRRLRRVLPEFLEEFDRRYFVLCSQRSTLDLVTVEAKRLIVDFQGVRKLRVDVDGDSLHIVTPGVPGPEELFAVLELKRRLTRVLHGSPSDRNSTA